MARLRDKVKRSLQKTLPDIAALIRGQVPGFVYGGTVRGLPIFTFHVVDERFELGLSALRDAGYRTAGPTELESYARGERQPDDRTVAVTFDDGDRSLVETAVPLLLKYEARAVAFVVSGQVPPVSTGYLSGWKELRHGVAQGVLGVGAHSLHHHHVPVARDVVGFVTPATPTDFWVNLPIPRPTGSESPSPGHPIFKGAPRYLAKRAFLPSREALDRCVELVAAKGMEFFDDPRWNKSLREELPIPGRFEDQSEADDAVLNDMRHAMDLVEQNCPNPAARHFCYPWFAHNGRTDWLAHRAGVRVAYGGVTTRRTRVSSRSPAILQRLPPDLIWRLPGPHRRPMRRIAAERARGMVSTVRSAWS